MDIANDISTLVQAKDTEASYDYVFAANDGNNNEWTRDGKKHYKKRKCIGGTQHLSPRWNGKPKIQTTINYKNYTITYNIKNRINHLRGFENELDVSSFP